MNHFLPALPLVIGFILDVLLGDPHSFPHPVRLIGRIISFSEKHVRRIFGEREKAAGTFISIMIPLISFAVPCTLCIILYGVNIAIGCAFESILCYWLIAARSLKKESMKVYNAILGNDVEKARYAVSMIVGRDTKPLDRNGIVKAAVETVAENTSDGVTAPIFWIMLGGAPAGFFYKAVNTLDSMIGYKNDRYINFGRFAAKFDDIMNFIPSRITALVMIISAYITGLDGYNACRVWKSDRLNHASPNSAQTESVCAGALGVQLAGDAYYSGVLCRKQTIGRAVREIENEDIRRSNRLMYCTSVIMLIIAAAVRIFIFGGLYE